VKEYAEHYVSAKIGCAEIVSPKHLVPFPMIVMTMMWRGGNCHGRSYSVHRMAMDWHGDGGMYCWAILSRGLSSGRLRCLACRCRSSQIRIA